MERFDPLTSFLSHLTCARCTRIHDAGELQSVCVDCGAPLLAEYHLEAVARTVTPQILAGRPFTLWRYEELLPVRNPAFRVTLGEGGTPLLRLCRLGEQVGLSNLVAKHEGLNPTGCFKDRGMATAVSRAWELGAKALVAPSAGNAGGAMAAYAARAGLPAHVIMPADAPVPNIVEVRATGGNLRLIDGLIDEAGRQANEFAAAEQAFNLATLREPYRIEGKKTMGYELAEQLGWRLPDVVVCPTGGGTGLIGMWKAFAEMEALGWIESGRRPRMVSVQASGCAPIVAAFRAGAEESVPWRDAQTDAAGLRVPYALGDFLVLRALYDSRGMAIAVKDAEMVAAQSQLGATEGIFAGMEAAATVAAVTKLRESGWLAGDEEVLLLITSSGLKQ